MTEERHGDWIQTYTGRKFWPLDPRPEDVDIEDIAHALSNQCRFSGHTRRHYSVAQHSLLVSHHVPDEHKLWALLHDASEAYLQDVSTPVKRMAEMQPYRVAEGRCMLAICRAFGLDEVAFECVHEADRRALATEARELLPGGPVGWHKYLEGVEPYPEAIRGMEPSTAKRAFLAAFHHYRQMREAA